MEEKIQKELEGLQNLEEGGTLTEEQTLRLEELRETTLSEGEKTPENQEGLVKSLQAQKEHFRTKFQKSEEGKKTLQEEIEKLKSQLPEKEEKSLEGMDTVQLMQTVHSLRDYSPEELEIISRNARGAGISLVEASKLEDVQLTIQARREKVAKESKIPEPTFRGATFQKKPLHELTKEELKESYDEVVAEAVRAGKKSKENI